jgi:hypothetical protein
MSSVSVFHSQLTGARAVVSPGNVGSALTINDQNFIDHKLYCILSNVDLQDSVNVNVMYAADGATFLHVPGDKVGAMKVTGLAFRTLCNVQTDSSQGDVTPIGAEYIYSWYHRNKTSASITTGQGGDKSYTVPLIKLTIGTKTELSCYLVGLTLQVADLPAHLFGFSLNLLVAPSQTTVELPKQENAAESDNISRDISSSPPPLLPD